ncbi:MAG: ATP-binding cassette domain-containing protein [Bacteroidota bacterium]
MNTIVSVSHVSFSYQERRALDEVSFNVQAGEIFGLLGPNSGGKTTLFRILSTLLVPSDGQVKIFGLDVVRAPASVRTGIGVVFQSASIDRKLTVSENLRHQGHLYGLHGKYLHSRIDELLDRFKLSDRAQDLVETLSGGSQRRVELAKAFLHRPLLLLLDEPTTGLDPTARHELWQYLEELRSTEEVTILLTTHIMDDAEHCDRLGILEQGYLVACDSPTKLKEEIGGDMIIVETDQPENLRKRIQRRFRTDAIVLDGMVRIEQPKGHKLITRLIEAFPKQIDSVSLRKPTLEDVFIRKTGHKLSDEA